MVTQIESQDSLSQQQWPSALKLREVSMLAAIDIGTNSIHMVVVKINPDLPAFDIVDAEKSTVRLGERCPDTGNLTPEATVRAIAALRRCQEIARGLEGERGDCGGDQCGARSAQRGHLYSGC